MVLYNSARGRTLAKSKAAVSVEIVRDRLLREIYFENKLPALKRRRQRAEFLDMKQKYAEALRGLVHGLPGTGNSAVIQWIVRMLEAGGYTDGVEFVCVAFQNRVAHTMKGSTLHHAGDVAVGDKKQRTQAEAHRC